MKKSYDRSASALSIFAGFSSKRYRVCSHNSCWEFRKASWCVWYSVRYCRSDTHKDQNCVLNFVNLPLLPFAVGPVWEPVRTMDACYSLPSSAWHEPGLLEASPYPFSPLRPHRTSYSSSTHVFKSPRTVHSQTSPDMHLIVSSGSFTCILRNAWQFQMTHPEKWQSKSKKFRAELHKKRPNLLHRIFRHGRLASPLLSGRFAWRQAAQRPLQFQFAVSRGPRILVQTASFDITFLASMFKADASRPTNTSLAPQCLEVEQTNWKWVRNQRMHIR